VQEKGALPYEGYVIDGVIIRPADQVNVLV
jgi:hypothetical protein